MVAPTIIVYPPASLLNHLREKWLVRMTLATWMWVNLCLFEPWQVKLKKWSLTFHMISLLLCFWLRSKRWQGGLKFHVSRYRHQLQFCLKEKEKEMSWKYISSYLFVILKVLHYSSWRQCHKSFGLTHTYCLSKFSAWGLGLRQFCPHMAFTKFSIIATKLPDVTKIIPDLSKVWCIYFKLLDIIK